MNLRRKLTSLLLALALLGHALTLALAAWPSDAGAPMVARVASSEAPCHDMAPPLAGAKKPACCEKSCPHMAACAALQLALLPSASFGLHADGARLQPRSTTVLASSTYTDLFRPPIALHA